MIYSHKVLTEQESANVLALLKHYEGYDKLDILIEMSVDDPAEILTRVNINKKNIEVIKTEAMPQEVMYCTSDHCEIDYTKNKKSC